MGRITIGGDMVQFSCKLDADPALWDTRAGRVNGKSHHARAVNGEIDKINVAVNAGYREIVSLKGQATAEEVKNAFQGISAAQETILKVFREHNDEYRKRIGITCAVSTWRNYDQARAHLERFIHRKYHVSDLPFRQLDESFIESYAYYLRIDCRLKPDTMLHKLSCLRRMVSIAIGRGVIARDPFCGYSPERPQSSPNTFRLTNLENIVTCPCVFICSAICLKSIFSIFDS
jgi:hypothetical protein